MDHRAALREGSTSFAVPCALVLDVVCNQVKLHPWSQLGCLECGALGSAWATLEKSGNLAVDVIYKEEEVL